MSNWKFIFIVFVLICFGFLHSNAQETYIIEPSCLEVCYKETMGDYKADFSLRCGKTTSQYFSLYDLRCDSLDNSPDPAMPYLLHDEFMEAMKHSDDPDKRLPESPNCGEYLYRNINKGKVSVYTSVMGDCFVIEEDIPQMDWTICADSTKMVLGYLCYKATTRFRGRTWNVWYADEIPVSLGPWKFGGLPGMILQVKCDGFMEIDANSIRTGSLAPVTFYNFYERKFGKIEREKYLKMRTSPNIYPTGTKLIPQMELE